MIVQESFPQWIVKVNGSTDEDDDADDKVLVVYPVNQHFKCVCESNFYLNITIIFISLRFYGYNFLISKVF